MNRRSIATLMACVLGLVFIAGANTLVVSEDDPGDAKSADAQSTPSLADPNNQAQVEAGAAIYALRCAACHGANLEGQPNWREALPQGGYPAPPHNGTGHTWRHGDQQLFEATKFAGEASAGPGQVSNMPGQEALLSDEEIWAAIAFIKSRWPMELVFRQKMKSRISARSSSNHAHH